MFVYRICIIVYLGFEALCERAHRDCTQFSE